VPGFLFVARNFPVGGFLFRRIFKVTAEGGLGKLAVAAKKSTISF